MASFGESLRRERELRDISLREIADATKINLRYLEALEQNRFDILPGGVFNKGFIRAYARFIGADGESLVDLYLQETAPRDTGAPSASGNSPGLLRLAEPPARRADPAPTPAAPTGAAKPVTPVPFPAAGSPGASQPIAEARSAPAPRPVAPLRIATAPAHHEPLTERAAALAAITNPNLAAQLAPRRRPRLTPGIALAAGGVLLAGGIAILVTRGLGAGDRARHQTASAAGVALNSDAESAGGATPLDASLAPSIDSAAAPPLSSPEGTTAGSIGVAGAPLDPAPATPKLQALPGDPAASPTPAAPARPRTPPVGSSPTARDGGPAASAPANLPAPAEEPARPPVTPGMEFRIEATNQVWVQVSCDGEDRVNRMLQAGEGASLRCLSAVKVSVTDGG
ncbi:MAG TPA: helix-turn-helix domain-containing protein, partial [Dongiaceae bacterium]|nr:helix-turn-helix domain-containing protein [Dongiaceae bacterium]